MFPSLPLVPPAWMSSAEAGPAPGGPMSHLRSPRGPEAPTLVPPGPGRYRPPNWQSLAERMLLVAARLGGEPLGSHSTSLLFGVAYLPHQPVRPQRSSGLGPEAGGGEGSEGGAWHPALPGRGGRRQGFVNSALLGGRATLGLRGKVRWTPQ